MWYAASFRRALFQFLLLALIVVVAAMLWRNTAANMAARGLVFSFAFLDNSAGFAVSQHLLPYQESDSYGWLCCKSFCASYTPRRPRASTCSPSRGAKSSPLAARRNMAQRSCPVSSFSEK